MGKNIYINIGWKYHSELITLTFIAVEVYILHF